MESSIWSIAREKKCFFMPLVQVSNAILGYYMGQATGTDACPCAGRASGLVVSRPLCMQKVTL